MTTPNRNISTRTTPHRASTKVGRHDEPSTLYSKGFYQASELIPRVERLEAKLAETTYKPLRRRYERTIRQLNNRFARLTTRHYEFNRLVAQYADQHDGKIENIASLITWLKEEHDIPIVADKGRGPGLTERAARIRIRNLTGIVGKPGYKPR